MQTKRKCKTKNKLQLRLFSAKQNRQWFHDTVISLDPRNGKKNIQIEELENMTSIKKELHESKDLAKSDKWYNNKPIFMYI